MDRSSKLNTAYLEAEDNKHLAALHRDALKVDFALTADEHRALEHMYRPLVVKAGTRRPNGHAIGASHQRFATKFAHDFALNHKNIIEIGPNTQQFSKLAIGNPLAHGCTRFSARDQSRHFTAASSSLLRGLRPNRQQMQDIAANGMDQLEYHQRVNTLATGLPSDTFCVDGFEFCNFQAKVAISIHSLYDITLGQLAVGMEEHGIHNIRAWMHIPIQALEVETWTDYDNAYQFKTTGTGKDAVIHFNFLDDTAFGYEHNRASWLSYLTTGAIDTPFGFGMTIEKVRHNGSQFELNIHRVTAGGAFYYRIPNALINLCRVPNFTKLALNSMCKRQEVQYIITDSSKVRKLFEFVHARKDAGFTIDTVKAYARTLINEVRLGEKIVEYHWNVTTEEFSQLCLSVYLLAHFQRHQDLHVTRKALRHLEKIDKFPGFLERTWNRILAWLDKHDIHCAHKHKTDHVLDGKTRNLFMTAQIKFYDAYDSHTSVKTYEEFDEINFTFEPPDFKPTIDDVVKMNENAEKDLILENTNSENPVGHRDWGLVLGIHAVLPTAAAEDYIAEDQHSTLILETEKNIATTECVEEQKYLARALSSTLPFLKKTTPRSLNTEKMILLKGVPGSGKTRKVLQNIIPSVQGKVVVLCPTGELKEKYEKSLPHPHRAFTVHKGMGSLERMKPDLVVIEEAFTLPVAYINAIAEHYNVLLVGDPQQITHVDFSGLWTATTKLEKYLPYIATEEMLITKRCPADITMLPLIRRAYPRISSSSPVKTSISHKHAGFVSPSNTKILCFTQAEKSSINNSGKEGNANTVAEVQGRTFESVLLHYAGAKAERDLIARSQNYLVVGLTRHTNELFIRDQTAGKGETGDIVHFINDSNPISFFADTATTDLNALDSIANVKPITIEDLDPNPVPYAINATEESIMAAIISKTFPAPPISEQQATLTTQLNHGPDLKGTLRTDLLCKDQEYQSKPHHVHRFPTGQRVKVTRSSDQLMLTKTMLQRLSAHTKNLTETVATELAERLFNQVAPNFNWNVTKSDLDTCLTQACEKFQQRGHNLDDLKDIASWTERSANLVKAFLKTQEKFCGGSDPNTKDKAGQGISAWDKSLNFQLCTWTRLLELVLIKQPIGKITITSGMSDHEVISLLEQEGAPDDLYLENDWTEFDSSQNNVGRKIFLLALERIGCPKNLRDQVAAQLSQRTIASDALSLQVNDKKDSGAPHTLIDNCLFNMAVCFDIMQDFRKIYIKGDDSLARGKHVKFDFEKLKQYYALCNWTFKPLKHSSGSYVSFIVNKEGCALDLFRIAGKVLSRSYKNKADFDNYRDAIGVTMRDVNMSSGTQMTRINSLHYRGTVSSTADFDSAISFLLSFARGDIPFSRTIQTLALTYITDCRPNLGDGYSIDASKRKKIPNLFTPKPKTGHRSGFSFKKTSMKALDFIGEALN
jgi:hypothetical protein